MRWSKLSALLLGFSLLLCLRTGHAAEPVVDTGIPQDTAQHILIFGDSLSAEYGLPRGSGWIGYIERRLAEREQAYQIRNASISGDTTIGGLRRLPQALEQFPADIVILQLGANDGLRGLPVDEMKSNLKQMIQMIRAHGADVLLVGQHIPPNYGQRYANQFHQAFIDIAREMKIALVPFMLEEIATNRDMFQADGLHPTAEAQQLIARTIWPYLEPLLN